MSDGSVQDEVRGDTVLVVGMASVAPSGAVQGAGPRVLCPPGSGCQSDRSGRTNATFRALRQRWVRTSVFGAVLGAVVAAVVWQVIPTTYTCFSELRIRPGRSITAAQQGAIADGGRFAIYKQTVMKQVTDLNVLTAALRYPEVVRCPALRGERFPELWLRVARFCGVSGQYLRQDEPFPHLWLRENIVVSAPDTEFIRISLTTGDPGSAYEIVSAITSEFNLQVIERYRRDTSDQLDQLRELLRTEDARLQTARKRLKEMDRSMHASSTGEAAEKKKAMLEMYARLQSRIHDVSMELIQQKLMAKHLGTLRKPAESAPSEVPVDFPDGIVDHQLQNEAEYQRLQQTVSSAQQKLEALITRDGAGDPKVAEAQSENAAAIAALDAYIAGRRPAIDAELREEQKKYATGQPRPGDEALVVEKIRFLETVKQGLEEELKTIRIEEESFGDAVVTRTELAEENMDLERRVKGYEDRVYQLQVAVDTDPPPIEVTHQPELPRQPELTRKIRLATFSGLGICCAGVALGVCLELRRKRVNRVNKSLPGSIVMTLTPHA